MSRKRIVAGRGSLLTCALLIIVACGNEAGNEQAPVGTSGTRTTAEAQPYQQVASGGARASLRSGGTGGAGGVSGSASGGVSGMVIDPARGGISGTGNAPASEGTTGSKGSVGPSAQVLGAGGVNDEEKEDEESEVLELPSGWTPGWLGPSAWYVATSADYEVDTTTTYTTTWHEHQGNGRDLKQVNGWAAELMQSSWSSAHSTMWFDGSALMTTEPWPDSPMGTNTGFTVLAVMRSELPPELPQSAGVAGWWGEWGDAVWANIRSTNTLTVLDFHRLDDATLTQMFAGNQDLGTGAHAVAWRYSPSTGTATLMVDGTLAPSRPQPPVGNITPMPLIVGAMSLLPTGLFRGEISELVIVGTDISDENLQNFNEYARNTWNLPAPNNAGPCIKFDGTHSPETTRCDDGNAQTFGDHCAAGTCVGTLPGAGNPNELGPVAWYHAGDPEVVITSGGVSTWYDRSPQQRDLLNGYWGFPTLVANGWNGNKPTVTFSGANALRRNAWTGQPGGTEGAFTVLAVLRPTATQTSGVVSWWHPSSYGHVAAKINATGSEQFLNLFRRDDFLTQDFAGTLDVPSSRHVVAWRYENGTAKLTVDGVTQSQTHSPIGQIPPDWFLMGVANGFGGNPFSGDISELAVIPRSITDAEIASFTAYAQGEWGGLPVTPSGGPCASTAECQAGLECMNGTCGCAQCDAQCQCGPGQSGCTNDAGCQTGLFCMGGTCKPGGCSLNPVLFGCGYPGAPCGACTTNPECQTSADCPSGLVCRDGNGWRYGAPGMNVCEEPGCPELECGQITSRCGLCECVVDCSNRQCGDANLDNGCNGRCTAVCDDGESGCQIDSDCQPGSVCLSGTCRPADPCLEPNVAPPDCGGPSTICGACPTSAVPSCADRVCGTDPHTGASCGPICGAGEFCTAAGRCARIEATDVIRVPNADGSLRPVVVPPASSAPDNFGAIPGAFAVSDMGSATYTIPIEVPPGRGVEPQLTLRYVSGAPNGALGVGWSLSGLSSISRCSRTFAQDGHVAPIKGTTEDALCLDGQRLVRVGGTDWQVGAEYRTQVDTFSKVKIESGPFGLYFRVFAKDGRILSFGQSASSRVEFQAGIVGTWALDYAHDRAGNFMRITYRQPPVYSILGVTPAPTSELLPHSITYSGHGTVEGDREIVFRYESRGDSLSGRRPGGGRLTRTQLLRWIDIKAQSQNVRQYELGYEYVNRVSRLDTIKECNGPTLSSCRAPTELTYYDDQGFGPKQVAIWPSPFTIGNDAFRPLGMVHSGSAADPRDLFSNVSVTSYGWTWTPIPFGVIESVSYVPTYGAVAAAVLAAIQFFGQEDHVRFTHRTRTSQFNVGSSGFFDVQTLHHGEVCGGDLPHRQVYRSSPAFEHQEIHDTCPRTSGLNFAWTQPVWLMDLDGDGVEDKLYCQEASIPSLDVKFADAAHTPSPFVPKDATHAERDLSFTAFGDICRGETFSTQIDVDGDGSLNLVVFDKNLGWAALVYDGVNSSFSWRTDWFQGLSIEPNLFHYVTPIDVNGDGLKDLLALPNVFHFAGSELRGQDPRVAINTGNGFQQRSLDASPDDQLSPEHPGHVLDIDGDGIEELVEARNTDGWYWRARRVNGGRLVSEPLPALDGISTGTFGDFDGDGDADILSRNTAGGTAPPVQINLGDAIGRNALKTIVDGVGRRIDVTYSFAVEAAHEGCHWPQRCMKNSAQAVVSTHTASHYDDRARTLQTTDAVNSYTYGTARVDVAGYGPLGFDWREVEVRDGVGAFISKTNFGYKAPPAWDVQTSSVPYSYVTAGLVESVSTTTPHPTSGFTELATTRLNVVTTFDWQEGLSSKNLPFPKLASKTTTTRSAAALVSGMYETIETFEVDAFGNVFSETRRTYDLEPGIGGGPLANSESVLEIDTAYSPTEVEQEAWLVSLPKAVDVASTPRCDMTNCTTGRRTRHVTYEYYPGTNYLHFERREMGVADLQRVTEYVQDGFGNVSGEIVTDAYGNVRHREYTFDERRLFPTAIIDFGEGRTLTTQVRYDDRFGSLVSRADPNGIDETYSYDDYGVLRHYRGPNGQVDTEYSNADLYTTQLGIVIPAASRITTTEAGGTVTQKELNSFGRVVRSSTSGFNGVPVFQEFLYDVRQRVRFQTRPHLEANSDGTIEFDYDDLDRIKEERYPDGAVVARSYLLERRETMIGPQRASMMTQEIVDPRGFHTKVTTNRSGQPVEVSEHAGPDTRYRYGAFDQLLAIEYLEADIAFTYDGWSRQLSKWDNSRGGAETKAYNGLDEVKMTGDPAGRTRHYVYDDFGRLDHVMDPDGTTQYLYDGAGPNQLGRLVESISPTGQRVSYEFEPRANGQNRGLMNRVTQRIVPAAGSPERTLSTRYHFNGFAQLEQIDYPGEAAGSALSVRQEFDAVGNVIRVYDTNNSTQTYWRFVDADQGYRLRTERVGAAACGGIPQNGTTTTRTYVPFNGRLESITTECGDTDIQALSYQYDLAGNMTQRANALGGTPTQTFGYDSMNRPTTTNGTITHEYDDYTNTITSTAALGAYSYDFPDWLIGAGQNSFEHDLVGNVNIRQGPDIPGGIQTIDYTTFDLPRSIVSGPPGSSSTTGFAYDANGTRVLKQNETTSTFYAGDLYQRIEVSGMATKHRSMIYAGGRAIAERIVEEGGAPTIRYLHDDALGSIQTVTSASGSPMPPRDYALFGRQSTPLSSSDVPYGFTGHEEDPELGLINMKGRIYDPLVGQFLTPDPITTHLVGGRGLNRFAYVENSPLNYVDPTGLFLTPLAKVGIAVGAGYAIAEGHGEAVVAVGASAAIATIGLMTYNPLQGGAVASVAAPAGGGGEGGFVLQGAGTTFTVDILLGQTFYPDPVWAVEGQVVPAAAQQQTPGSAPSPLPPTPTSGVISASEPLADPKIKDELWRAWKESRPSATPNPNTREQGGWIIERTSKLGRFFKGRYYVERWAPGTGSSIPVPKPPPGARVVGSFHTHPNMGPAWVQSASPADWGIFGSGRTPHYIVSEPGIYRIGSGGQQFLGPLNTTIAPPPSVGCSCGF